MSTCILNQSRPVEFLHLRNLAPNEDGIRRAHKMGGTEYIHSLVCSGTVSWSDAEGKTRAEELNLPPRQVTSTASKQVGPRPSADLGADAVWLFIA